ncbi:MAG: DUF2804 family protein [Bacilli bacterium]
MIDYSKFISQQRRNQATPKALVENGKALFGTFDREFTKLNILDCKNPTFWGNLFKKKKLSLWEALTLDFQEGLLLSAVVDLGFFGMGFNIFFDKQTKKIYSFQTTVSSNDVKFAANLLGGKETSISKPNFKMAFINDFDDGFVQVDSIQQDKKVGNIAYHLKLNTLSKPSIVSIPFGKNRPLATEKQFFKASGSLTINGKKYYLKEAATAVIDDHRAYYPRRAHYDWLTCLGKDERGKFQAFNLTRNQSINQENYNENLIWKENSISILPPVTFTHTAKSKDFVNSHKTPTQWMIKDKHDMVNLRLDIKAMNSQRQNYLIARSDYFVVFGVLNGYIRDENGTIYNYDGRIALGEDKTIVL